MNQPQTIYLNLLSKLPLMLIENGYQRDYIEAIKGIPEIGANNKFMRPMIALDSGTAQSLTENNSEGLIQAPAFIMIDFKTFSGQGNIDDECEVILQDLTDFVTGTFGEDKCLVFDQEAFIRQQFIDNFYRSIDWKTNIGRCGIRLMLKYIGKI